MRMILLAMVVLLAACDESSESSSYVRGFPAPENYTEKLFSDGEGRLLMSEDSLRVPFELGCTQDSYAPPCDQFDRYRWDVRVDGTQLEITFTHRHQSVRDGESPFLYGFFCVSSSPGWRCVVGRE